MKRATSGWLSPTIVFGVLVALAPSARAGMITLTPGNNPQSDEANVLFNHGDFSQGTGTPLTFPPPPPFSLVGTTNNTVPPVSVRVSSSQNLYAQGGGQGLIIATSVPGDPTTQIGFTDFTIGLPTTTSLDMILDAHLTQGQGQPGTGGTATITAFESNGTPWTFTGVPIDNGENFQTLVASGGADIKSVEFVMDGTGTSTTQLQQIRISGLADALVVGTPEPTSLTLLGLGSLGLLGYGWRRRKQAAA